MQSFKLFWRLINARKRASIIALAIYFLISICFFYANRHHTKSFKAQSIKIGLVQTTDSNIEQGGELVQAEQAFLKSFLAHVGEGNELIYLSDDENVLKQSLYDRKSDVLLRLPNGFLTSWLDTNGKKLKVELKTKDNQLAYHIIEARVSAFLRNWQILQSAETVLDTKHKTDIYTLINNVQKSLDTQITVRNARAKEYNLLNIIAYNGLPILSYAFIVAFISIMAGNFYIMNQKNLKQRDEIGNVRASNKLLSTYLAALLFGVAYWLVFILFIHLLYGHFVFSLILMLLYAASLLNMFCLIAFAIFIAEINSKPGVTQFLSTILSLLISFGSGIFVPLELVSKPLRTVSMLFSPIWNVKLNYLLLSYATWSKTQKTTALKYIAIQLLLLVTYLMLSLLLRYYRSHKKARS